MSLGPGSRPSRAQLIRARWGAYCSLLFAVLIAVGWLGIADFWLPAPADLTAEATKTFYTVTHRDGMLIGNTLLIIGTALLVTGSIQFGQALADIEGPRPLWSITAGMCGSLIALIIFLNAAFWIGAAYRPEAGADVVVALNDVSWFGFLLGWVFLSMQLVATAIVALTDESPSPLFPRWLSIASIAGAILLAAAGGPAFFKSGPLAYHGWAAFYMPMVIWGLWLIAHELIILRDLNRRIREAPSVMPAEAHSASL